MIMIMMMQGPWTIAMRMRGGACNCNCICAHDMITWLASALSLSPSPHTVKACGVEPVPPIVRVRVVELPLETRKKDDALFAAHGCAMVGVGIAIANRNAHAHMLTRSRPRAAAAAGQLAIGRGVWLARVLRIKIAFRRRR